MFNLFENNQLGIIKQKRLHIRFVQPFNIYLSHIHLHIIIIILKIVALNDSNLNNK